MQRRGCGSLDERRTSIVRQLIREGMASSLPLVPGFRLRRTNGKESWSFGGPAGLLIPVRDEQGRIVAVMVRPDDPADGGKYRYCTSKNVGGPGPGTLVHVPLFAGNRKAVRVAEGMLKSDIATELSGVLTLGLPGVSAWRKALAVVKAIGAQTVRVALDADARTNPNVARSLAGLVELLLQEGFDVELEQWDPADGKGIDDLLAAGKRPAVLTGEDVSRAVQAILAAAGVSSDGTGPVALEEDDDPHRLARVFLNRHRDAKGRLLLCWWRGEYRHWRKGAYGVVPDGDLRAQLVATVKSYFDRLHREKLGVWQACRVDDDGQGRGKKGGPPKVQKVTAGLVTNTLQAVSSLAHLSSDITPPSWLSGVGPNPRDLVICGNAVVNLPALVANRANAILPPTPDLFVLNATDINFDLAAPEPVEWLRFLEQLWPDDPESRTALQQWYGYSLTPDTSQQKILLMVGPPRSGKGTIARVLTGLLGAANVAAPTLSSLGTNFGLWPLIDKSAAIISDARLGGRSDIAVITERLLSISGEDALTIDRKNLTPVTMQLPTRFSILTNELPRIADASGALAGRFIVLRLTNTFGGKEDLHLTPRLLKELPGILLWAIGGWQMLRAQGRLLQPKSAIADIQDLEDLASPIKAFVHDRCDIGAAGVVTVDALFGAWERWCEAGNRREPGTKATFGRDLRAAYPKLISDKRLRDGEDRPRAYRGIALRGVMTRF
jgi:putative DNA primase/helicase